MGKWFTSITTAILVIVTSCSCSKLPTTHTSALEVSAGQYEATILTTIFSAGEAQNNNESAFLLLRDGTKAFKERLYLADLAEHTIDAQYYIWNSDKTGKLLMQKLLQAADRGVSVRLLLDDFSIGDRNDQLLSINSHPNIQLRVNNPFIVRSGIGKWINFAFDFDRLNRRMHNKTYTIDSTVTITGGRNIGDEYFNQNEHLNFSDADVLSVGPVVQQVSKSFNQYWNSPWAVPIDQLIDQENIDLTETHIHQFLAEDLERTLPFPLLKGTEMLKRHYQHIFNELIWATGTFLADIPGGSTDEPYTDEPKRVARHLLELAGKSTREILIESAYFVLNEEALKLVGDIHSKGVRVRALTNSMSSNDVLPNHASYAMVRENMLDHGIELHELRPDASSCIELIGKKEYCDEDSHLGLHAKTAVFDREIVYIGSMNLNLRSAYLNTEAAMVINSDVLADQLSKQIELKMKEINSWQAVKKDGEILWITENQGQEDISSDEPLTSWLERMKAGLLKIVPGAEYY